jgi:hypothetical protein
MRRMLCSTEISIRYYFLYSCVGGNLKR